MEGIQYVTNEKGQKIAVQIDLKDFGELWEDFYDNILFHRRSKEPKSMESVKMRLKRCGEFNSIVNVG